MDILVLDEPGMQGSLCVGKYLIINIIVIPGTSPGIFFVFFGFAIKIALFAIYKFSNIKFDFSLIALLWSLYICIF